MSIKALQFNGTCGGSAQTLVTASLKTVYAVIYADAGNGGTISIGPTSAASLYPIPAGQWFVIPAPPSPPGSAPNWDGLFDLHDWYINGTNGYTYRIVYW